MGEQLYKYEKIYRDGKYVWERVPYNGGEADAVFPNTPEDQRNGKIPFSGSAKVDDIKKKQEEATLVASFRVILEIVGYRAITIQRKWSLREGNILLATLHYPLSATVRETLEMGFTDEAFKEWAKLPMQPKPVWFKVKGVGDRTPLNPLTAFLQGREIDPVTAYNRKLDVE